VIPRLSDLLAAAIVLGSVAGWFLLPERIPIHFGFSGEADAWTRTALWSWFLLPAVALATHVSMRWIEGRVEDRPELVNLPAKERFLELDREARRPVVREVEALLQEADLLSLVVYACVQLGIWLTATGDSGRAVVLTGLVVAGGLLPALLFRRVIRMQRELDQAWKRREAGGR